MSSWGPESPSVVEFGFDEADLTDITDEGRATPVVEKLVYPTVAQFVVELLLPTYSRKVDGRSTTWCLEWLKHPEAVVRLEALWRSWEHLRLDPALGMSVWLRDHLDHHLPVLLEPTGPFRGCSPTRGHTPTQNTLTSSQTDVARGQHDTGAENRDGREL